MAEKEQTHTEAPASINTRFWLSGFNWQLTIRTAEWKTLLDNTGNIAQRIADLGGTEHQPVKPNPLATPDPSIPPLEPQRVAESFEAPEPTCPDHNKPLRGGKGGGWYCPTKLQDGSWCKRKGQ